ncbi:histidine phosphatase family protein [Sphaerimonospora thailandensis]|uniref:Phosphoglycerate mutase n=1 Tax=Sphaerimonospora thailandensis TaxID=795644 RepID=A0A8J3VXT6_9ACTN|nr:histidine phosphatase family protein [Sphaerimonospora thailandensis]GIH68240.1 phosphoglycerate mutase [Sphaerimonospora thailandensis]
MTARVILITHAETAATLAARFPDDDALTARGREAAIAASRALPAIDGGCAGPERSCMQTAAALGLDVVPEPELRDLDVGDWRGRRLQEIEAEQPAELLGWLTDSRAAPHGGESVCQLIDRVAGWLETGAEGRSRIVAVTHQAVVRAAVLHALGAPPSVFWRIDARPLSQTRLSRHGGRWRLTETGHILGVDA